MVPKRLVLLVEGAGDELAAPVLIKRLLKEMGNAEGPYVDDSPFLVGGVENLTGGRRDNWRQILQRARKRPYMGGALLILDGDRKHVLDGANRPRRFCAADVARDLAEDARSVGAGSVFSFACVFACREFESWLLAGADSLRGRTLPDGRPGVKIDALSPDGDTEMYPRDAKGWFAQNMPRGYRQTADQVELTRLVDLRCINDRNPRSWRRLTHALTELCQAIRVGQHVCSPARTFREDR